MQNKRELREEFQAWPGLCEIQINLYRTAVACICTGYKLKDSIYIHKSDNKIIFKGFRSICIQIVNTTCAK